MAALSSSSSNPDAPYQVVARRFRPTRFDEVVGQEAVVEVLESALASGRIPHAFLFSGSRGVGKTTMARILARSLNCEQGPTAKPCGSCRACTSILSGANADVVEIDAASHNLVDDIRELRDRVGLASMGSRYKVYILDEVHMLTRSAFNAFLKTLEEPPKGVVFIMATTELLKVPETIRSRCQVHLFRRVEETDITRRLQVICEREKVAIPEEVLGEIASSSRGGMRDAEGALELLLPVAHQMGEAFDVATYRRLAHRVGFDAVVGVAGSLLQADAAAALRFADEAIGHGADEREILGELLEVLRAILLVRIDGEDSGLVTQAGQARERLLELARAADIERLEAMIRAGLLGRERIRLLEDRRLVLELALLAMARAGSLPQLAEILAAARGGVPMPATAPATGGAPITAPATGGGAAPPVPVVGAVAVPGGDLRGRLLAKLTEDHPMLARTVEHCAVSGPDAQGTVHFALQTERKLHRDRLAKEGVQRDLVTALEAVLGTVVKIAVGSEAQGASEAAAPSPPTAAGTTRPKAPPGPGVQKILERFDGQIMDDDDASERR